MSSLLVTKEYIKQIYATGYLGCMLFVGFITCVLCKLGRETDRKMAYIVMVLWVMLLGAGLTVESLEATQMSWFPMVFAGMLLSEKKAEQAEK